MSAYKCVFVVCLVLLGLRPYDGAASDRIAEARVMLQEAQTVKRGVAALERLAKGRDVDLARRARVALAAYWRVHGAPRKGAELLAAVDGFVPANLDEGILPAFLELALCEAADGRVREAAKRLLFARENTEGALRARALLATAELGLIEGQAEQAVTTLNDCLKYGDGYYPAPVPGGPSAAPEKPGADAWRVLRPEVVARLDEAERQWDAQRYGQGYAYYRLARKYHLARRYGDAITAYDLLIRLEDGTVYAEAARLYREQCRLKLGHAEEAIANLESFVKEKPMALYRGEALETLGVHFLETDADPDRAERYAARTQDWVLKAKQHDRDVELYTVPEKAAVVTAPPPQALEMVRLRLVPVQVEPGMVINRLTAPWYLDRLYWNACYYRGFIRFVKGDYDEALVEFSSALALNPQLQQQHDTMLASFQRRLEMACRGKRMFLTPEELDAFQGKERLRFRLGEFYALWERWDEAERVYRGFLDRTESTRNQKACALRALAEAARYKAPPDEKTALDLYSRLLKDYRRTPSEQPALLEMAALNQRSLDQQIAWLDEAYRIDPRTDTGQKALYMKGFILRCNGKKQAAVETLSEFIRRYPENRFVAVSRDLLAELK